MSKRHTAGGGHRPGTDVNKKGLPIIPRRPEFLKIVKCPKFLGGYMFREHAHLPMNFDLDSFYEDNKDVAWTVVGSVDIKTYPGGPTKVEVPKPKVYKTPASSFWQSHCGRYLLYPKVKVPTFCVTDSEYEYVKDLLPSLEWEEFYTVSSVPGRKYNFRNPCDWASFTETLKLLATPNKTFTSDDSHRPSPSTTVTVKVPPVSKKKKTESKSKDERHGEDADDVAENSSGTTEKRGDTDYEFVDTKEPEQVEEGDLLEDEEKFDDALYNALKEPASSSSDSDPDSIRPSIPRLTSDEHEPLSPDGKYLLEDDPVTKVEVVVGNNEPEEEEDPEEPIGNGEDMPMPENTATNNTATNKPEVDDDDDLKVVHEELIESDGTLKQNCRATTVRVKLEPTEIPSDPPRPVRAVFSVPPGKGPKKATETVITSEDQGSSWSQDEIARKRLSTLNPTRKQGLVVNAGPVGKPPQHKAKNPTSPSPNKSAESLTVDASQSDLFGNPGVSSTPQSNTRRDLFSANSEDIELVAQEILQEIRSLKQEVGLINKKLDVVTSLVPRDERFIVLAGSSALFENLLQTVHQIVQFPFHTLEQVNFHTRLLRQFDAYPFVLNVFFFNNTAGGSVFTVCNNLWNKMYSNKLSKKLAWADIGESSMVAEDYDDEEGGGRKKRLGKNNKAFHKLRSENPELRNLMMHIVRKKCVFDGFRAPPTFLINEGFISAAKMARERADKNVELGEWKDLSSKSESYISGEMFLDDLTEKADIAWRAYKEDQEVRAKACQVCGDRHTVYVKHTLGKRVRGVNDKLRTEYVSYCEYAHGQMSVEKRALDDLGNGTVFFKDWPDYVAQIKKINKVVEIHDQKYGAPSSDEEEEEIVEEEQEAVEDEVEEEDEKRDSNNDNSGGSSSDDGSDWDSDGMASPAKANPAASTKKNSQMSQIRIKPKSNPPPRPKSNPPPQPKSNPPPQPKSNPPQKQKPIPRPPQPTSSSSQLKPKSKLAQNLAKADGKKKKREPSADDSDFERLVAMTTPKKKKKNSKTNSKK